ncbi:pituitary tumor-transforming gene 1 protein-interacting protein-like [Scleropages formosus]|nr:pituitary tumor-transforming gene 1 protein-interacting protein-like [Scleropages formosus]
MMGEMKLRTLRLHDCCSAPLLLVVTFFFLLTTTVPRTSAALCAENSNTTCKECLKNVSCLWCRTTKKCLDYPVRTVLPPHSLCPLAEARWGLCWVNFQALIITMAVIGGVIIIAIFICCFCCCKCKNIGSKRTETKMEMQEEMRKARQMERKAEMKERHDEIRKKYGLAKENPYSKFENN